MSMRIRSTKSDMEAAGEDTEGMADSVSKLRSEVQALTGVDIMLDDSTYKSTYQILDELAQVWDKLNDVTQANVLELLFGKRQANIGAGLLKNFDIARDSLQTALDAEGSALRENEIFLESIQGHLNQLSAAWETFSYDFLDSDFVKGSVGFLTKIVNLLDDMTDSSGWFGSAFTAVTVAATAFFAKRGTQMFVAALKSGTLVQGVKDLVSALGAMRLIEVGGNLLPMTEGAANILNGLTKFKEGLAALAPLFLALTPLIAVLIPALDVLNKTSLKANNDRIAKAQADFDDAISQIEEYNDAIDNNKKKIKELNRAKFDGSKNSIVANNEIAVLEEENKRLEKKLELYQQIEQQRKKQLYADTRDAVNNTLGYSRDGYKHSSYNYIDSVGNLQSKIDELKQWEQQALDEGNLWAAEYFESRRTELETLLADVKARLLEWYDILITSTNEKDIELANKIGEALGIVANKTSDALEEATANPISVTVDVDISEATDAVDKMSSSFKTLSNAFKEQAENGSLSIDTILDIIDAGYAAALEIDAETGKVRLNTEAYKILAKAKIQEQIASLQARRAEIISDLLGEAQAANTTAASYLTLIAANAAAAEAVKGIDAAISALNKINVDSITAGVYGIEDAASSASSKLSSLLSEMNSLLSTTMDWLRQRYDDANDATKEWLESHKKALEKQLDDYNDLIDAQIKLLERQKEADDYAKKRKDKEKAVSDIENQLTAIANDDSVEAQKKRLELQEELAKAKDELANVQDDWNYDQRKQALEDEKQKYQDLIQAEIDAVQKRLDAVNKATISEMDLRREAYDWITNREEELYQNLILWNREYGDGLDATIDNLFKDADGWRAYGTTFKEALENLTRLAHDVQDAAGGIGSAFAESAQTAIKSMDDLIAALLDRAKLLESVGQTASAAIYKSIADRLFQLKDLGVELSEETSNKLFAVLENCDQDTQQLIFNVMSYLMGLKINGSEQFTELWQAFIDALTSADSALFNGGQNMISNLQTIFEALLQVRSLVDEVYRPTGQAAAKGAGVSGEILTPYAEGGVVDYTGPAMVHGKANSPEVVFNAAAASKLFNYVTRTPDLLAAAMVQGAGLLKGYSSASAYMASGSVGDININIAGNADSTTVAELKKVASGIKDDVIKTLNDSLKRRGITRSPRTV